ncbi:MAG TPA: DNA-binding protein [Polyangiaceae bacterium]
MQTADLDQQIRDRIEMFVQDLTALVRQSAVRAVTSALGESTVTRRGPGRPRSNGLASLGGGRRSGRPAGRRKGEKRAPEQLAALVDKLFSLIKGKPGQRIEEIATTLGISTKELTLPAKKLIAEKRVSTKGQKRATRYFAR